MKEDKMAILQPSPVSLLESTRQDFQALLSSPSSSDVSFKSKQSKVRLKSSKKKKSSASEPQSMEMTNVSQPLTKVDVKLRGTVNTAFWCENEGDPDSMLSSLSPRNKSASLSSLSAASNHVSCSEDASKEQDVQVHGDASIEEGDTEEDVRDCQSPDSALQESCSTSSPIRSESAEQDCSNCSLAVVIHLLNQLILEEPLPCPMVAVHVVNIDTGSYIQVAGVPVPPQFTGSQRPNMSAGPAHPVPNQELVFEFNVARRLHESLLLFEIVSELGAADGISRALAWAFLRPVSKLGVRHSGKKLQLQLYRVPVRRPFQRSKSNVQELYGWFKSVRKDKYPSYLTVSLQERSAHSNNLSCVHSDTARCTNESITSSSPLKKTRLSGQPFKLPTRRVYTRQDSEADGPSGALIARYSPEGSFIAVAHISGTIHIYSQVADGRARVSCKLKGHRGNVYDLEWIADAQQFYLLTCGADCTARVWNCSTTSHVVLPHPAYVYGCRYAESDRIATACYDHLIRLWSCNMQDPSVKLLASYAQHTAPVNCLCWGPSGRNLYTGDSQGSIGVWNTTDDRQLKFVRYLGNSGVERTVSSAPINWLCIDPSGTRILVHFRSNQLCLLDLKSGLKLVTYNGIYNPRLRLTSSISPCANYVVAGSEDGSLHWFDLQRGDLVAILSFGSNLEPITAVDFHPTDHSFIICLLNPRQQFVVLEYRKNDKDINGFSLVKFPMNVRPPMAPLSDIRNVNKTPHLDKVQQIFRKLDIVMTWTSSNASQPSNALASQ